MRNNGIIVKLQKAIRLFLQRRQLKKLQLKEVLSEPLKIQEIIKDLIITNKLKKDYSFYEEGSFSLIEDENDENKKKKVLTKKFHVFKILNFCSFRLNSKKKSYLLQNVSLMSQSNSNIFLLDFFFAGIKNLQNMRLKTSNKDNNDFLTKSSWKILTTLLEEWMIEKKLYDSFQKEQLKTQKEFTIYFNRMALKDEELEDFMEFAEILNFLLNFCFEERQKINGSCMESIDFSQLEQYNKYTKAISLYKNKKALQIKKSCCQTHTMNSALFTFLGFERKIVNKDYSAEYLQFYNTFHTPLTKVICGRSQLLEKFLSLQKIKNNISEKFHKNTKNSFKLRTFEEVLHFLENKNNQIKRLSHTKNQLSKEISDLKKSRLKSSESLKSIKSSENLFKDIDSDSQSINLSKNSISIFPTKIKSEDKFYVSRLNSPKKQSMPALTNQINENLFVKSPKKKNSRNNEKNSKILRKDLYCNEKPFYIVNEEEETESLNGKRFYKT